MATTSTVENSLIINASVTSGGVINSTATTGTTIQGTVVSGGIGATGQPGADGQDGAPGVGVPAGGSTGEVLVKTSNTDYATGWSAAPPSQATGLILTDEDGGEWLYSVTTAGATDTLPFNAIAVAAFDALSGTSTGGSTVDTYGGSYGSTIYAPSTTGSSSGYSNTYGSTY